MMARKYSTKPRNPLVAVSLFRQAGVHRKLGKAVRRADKMVLARLIKSDRSVKFGG